MAIREPKSVNRRGIKRKKGLGDRSYSVPIAFLIGGIILIGLSIYSFILQQWGSGIAFLIFGGLCYIPYKLFSDYPAIAYRVEEEGIRIYEKGDKEVFVAFKEIKRITVFNPELKANFMFNARRNVYITLKPTSQDEEELRVIRILFPYEPDAVYFQLLNAKIAYDGVAVDR